MARSTLSNTGQSCELRFALHTSKDTWLGKLTRKEPSGISVTLTPRSVAPDCSTSFLIPDQLYPATPPANAPIPAPIQVALLLSPIRAPKPAPTAAPAPAPTAVVTPRLISPVAQPDIKATAAIAVKKRVLYCNSPMS